MSLSKITKPERKSTIDEALRDRFPLELFQDTNIYVSDDPSDFEIIPDEQTPAVPEISDNTFSFLGQYNGTFHSFLEFAKNQPNAVGLAANQCSLNGKRFMARMFAKKDLDTGDWELIIDPKITDCHGGQQEQIEGCLTWKGRHIKALRHYGVTVSFRDINGDLHERKVVGFEAQIWQHEINHLNGIEEEVIERRGVARTSHKVQRNAPCPCGSGKKHKKCCGKV